jgi:hypothetical protein
MAKENPELAEVRAILSKVQRLGQAPEETPGAGEPAGQAQKPAPGRSGISVFDRKRAVMQVAQEEPDGVGQRAAIFMGALGIIAAAAVIMFATGVFNFSSEPLPLTPEAQTTLLTQVHQLFAQGDVVSARNSLSRGGPQRNASFAFALAQSYDPNYLQSLPNANSGPDISEAARWYKKWYELAVQSGLQMDPGQLQRIIGGLQRR